MIEFKPLFVFLLHKTEFPSQAGRGREVRAGAADVRARRGVEHKAVKGGPAQAGVEHNDMIGAAHQFLFRIDFAYPLERIRDLVI